MLKTPSLSCVFTVSLCVCMCVTCMCLYIALQTLFTKMILKWFLLINVVLSVIIAFLNVDVSSAKYKMPTINFSTPEQPPGDTRRKVSDFLGLSSMAVAWG